MDILETIKYIILGIIQGVTEPLPISSSGHLVILRNIFNAELFNDLNFEIMINFGSMIAIILVFKDDVIKLINSFIKYIQTKNNQYKSDFNYIMLLIIGTIPAGIIGLLFKDDIENFFLFDITMVGVSLLITGLLLYIVKDYYGHKKDNEIKTKEAFYVGLFQAIALIPGISRSGTTIVGAMLNDFKRETALKFSFFLYIPISIVSFLLGFKDIIDSKQLDMIWLPYLLGTMASIFATYYATKWFIKLTLQGKLKYFAYYCFIVGTLVIILL